MTLALFQNTGLDFLHKDILDEKKEVKALVKSGRYLDAARKVKQFELWNNIDSFEDCLTAANLAKNLDNNIYAAHIIRKGRKQWSIDRIPVNWQFFLWIQGGKSIWKQWHEIKNILQDLNNYHREEQEDIYLFASDLFASFNLFDRAEELLNLAEKIDLNPARRHFAYASLAHRTQNRQKAHKLCDDIRRRCKENTSYSYPRLYCWLGAYFQAYGETTKAIECLEECAEKYQFIDTHMVVSRLFCEIGRLPDAKRHYNILEGYRDYISRNSQKAIEQLAYSIAIEERDFDKAQPIAENFADKSDYFKNAAEKLKYAKENDSRIILDIPLVFQYKMTCVPASLASIAAFFGKKYEHDAIADEICADGVSDLKLAQWAEKYNWLTRSFVMNEEAIWALLEISMPFILFTSSPNSSHAQVVAGYDKASGELIFREPGSIYHNREQLDLLLKEQEPMGPFACVIYPPEKAEVIAGLELPGSTECEVYQDVLKLLAKHKLGDAQKAVDKLKKERPGHPVVHACEIQLLSYSGAVSKIKSVIRDLYLKYPENELSAWRYMLELQNNEQDGLKRRILTKFSRKKGSSPLFLSEMGELLSTTPAEQDESFFYSLSAVRRMPHCGAVYNTLGMMFQKVKDHEEMAFDALMLGSLLSPYNHRALDCWFDYAKEQRRENEVLSELRKRVAKLESKSETPAIMLAYSLTKLNRFQEAFEVLEHQTAIYDENHHAESYLYNLKCDGPFAKDILNGVEKLKGRMIERNWFELIAKVYSRLGETEKALEILNAAFKKYPYDPDIFPEYLWQQAGQEKDLESFLLNLLEKCAKYGLSHVQRIFEFASRAGLDNIYRRAVELALEIDPQNVYIIREYAFYLDSIKQIEKSREIYERLISFAYHDAYNYGLEGTILLSEGKANEALEAFLKSVELDVNYQYAFSKIAECMPDNEDARRKILQRLLACLEKQVIDNGAVFGITEFAENLFAGQQLREIVDTIVEKRPDLEASWMVLIDIYSDSPEVFDFIERAERHLPHKKDIFELRKAYILNKKGNTEAAIETLKKLIAEFPGQARALANLACRYADAYKDEQAEKTFKEAIRLEPYDAILYIWYSEFLVKQCRLEDACAIIDSGLQKMPNDQNLLENKLELLNCMGNHAEALELSNDVIKKHPNDIDLLLKQVDALFNAGMAEDAFAALDNIGRRFPSNKDYNDKKIQLLTVQLKFEEAFKVAEGAAEKCPDINYFMICQAEIRYKQDKIDNALAILKQSVEKFPAVLHSRIMLIEYLRIAKKSKEALEFCEQGIELFPEADYLKNLQAEILGGDLDQKDKAFEVYRSILSKNSGNTQSLCGLFDLILDKYNGDADKAFEALEFYNPSKKNPYIGCRMVLAAFVTRKRKEAKEWLENFVMLDSPDMEDLYEYIVSQIPQSYRISRGFLKQMLILCKRYPEKSDLLIAYMKSCLYLLNPDCIIYRHGLHLRLFKSFRLALKNNPKALRFFISNLRFMSSSYLINIYIFLKKNFILNNHSCFYALLINHLERLKGLKIYLLIKNRIQLMPPQSLIEAQAVIYGYVAAGKYEDAGVVFEDAVRRFPYDRDSVFQVISFGLFINALQENWENCSLLYSEFCFEGDEVGGIYKWHSKAAKIFYDSRTPEKLDLKWERECKLLLEETKLYPEVSIKKLRKQVKKRYRKYKNICRRNAKQVV